MASTKTAGLARGKPRKSYPPRSGTQRGPSRVTFRVAFLHGTLLRYEASVTKSGAGAGSAARFAAYRSARSVGEFFDLHPGAATIARRDLAWDLRKALCSVPGFVAPRFLRSAGLDPAGAAHGVVATASVDSRS